jgi:hypothetical protein
MTLDKALFTARGFQSMLTERAVERLRKNLEWDRQIRAQPCGTCGAVPGNPCYTRTGNLCPTYHLTRRRYS